MVAGLGTLEGLCPEDFSAETAALFSERPAQSRRVANRVADAIASPDNFRLFVVRDAGGDVVGAVVYHLSGSYVWAAGHVRDEVAEALIGELVDEFGFEFNGFSGCDGPPAAVEALTSACCDAFGCVPRCQSPLQTMLLDMDPKKTTGIPGRLRAVSPADKLLLPVLAQWFADFEKDLGSQDYSLAGTSNLVADLSAAAGRKDLFVWEVKDKPVAMVMAGRTRPKQLLCVYTIPHQRGRGFGQAATAAVCAEKRQGLCASEPIILNADRKFGAQRLYERVGFKSDGLLHGVTFDAWC